MGTNRQDGRRRRNRRNWPICPVTGKERLSLSHGLAVVLLGDHDTASQIGPLTQVAADHGAVIAEC